MKNRFDYIKSKYTAWTKLKNKTGNVYDPVSNMFNLSDEEWLIETKSNKHAATLRTAPLLFPDLCIKLFDGATSTGVDAWGPSSTLPHPSEELPDLNLNEDDDMDFIQSKQPPTSRDSHSARNQPAVSEESSGNSRNRAQKRKGKDTYNSKMLEIGEDIAKVARILIEKNTVADDMDACTEKLEMFEWGDDDERYICLLFGESADLRKMWLRLKPNCCEAWIRRAGRKHGFLD